MTLSQLPERALTMPDTRQLEASSAQHRVVDLRRLIPDRDVGEVRPVLVAVAAVVVGVGGIGVADPELRVRHHLEAEAARQRVVAVEAHAAAERRWTDSFRPRYSCVPTAAWLSRLLISAPTPGSRPTATARAAGSDCRSSCTRDTTRPGARRGRARGRRPDSARPDPTGGPSSCRDS